MSTTTYDTLAGRLVECQIAHVRHGSNVRRSLCGFRIGRIVHVQNRRAGPRFSVQMIGGEVKSDRYRGVKLAGVTLAEIRGVLTRRNVKRARPVADFLNTQEPTQ